MSVSVVKTHAGDYRITINGESIVLPAESTMTEDRRKASVRYGTPTKYIELEQGGEVAVVEMGVRRVLADEDEGLEIAEEFSIAWSDPEEEAPPAPAPKAGMVARALKAAKKPLARRSKGSSRLNRKTRRAKGKRRNTKRR